MALTASEARERLQTLRDSPKGCATIPGISLDDFRLLTQVREELGSRIRFRDYDGNSETLVVTAPSIGHELAHHELFLEVELQICAQGLRSSWQGSASRTFHSAIHNSAKESDSSGGPRPERSGEGKWPTLVIECGVSESLAELRVDMRRWFAISHHEVKIVILVKVNASQIIFERWDGEPELQQTVIISHDGTGTGQPNISEGHSSDLVLKFGLLFLRDPRPGEKDIVITTQQLLGVAQCVWENML